MAYRLTLVGRLTVRINDDAAAEIDRLRGDRTVGEWLRSAIDAQIVREGGHVSAGTARTKILARNAGWDPPPPLPSRNGMRHPLSCAHPVTARRRLPHSVECGLCGAVLR